MKQKDLADKTHKELTELLAEQRAELQNLRFQAHSGQLKQFHKVKEVRRTIARLTKMLAGAKEDSK